MSTDDRYADDVHYKGGCVLATDMLHWSTSMLHEMAKPPHEVALGDEWRERWHERLEADSPWAHHWLAHQRRDDYWRHGSVCEDYGAIDAAVYAIGGWIDGYTNSVLRLLEGLPGPRKGLIGPWPHSFPHTALPDPMGFLTEALRWWDHWLKGIDTGIMDEPMLRVWLQEHLPPRPLVEHQPGRWAAEEAWPSPRIKTDSWALGADGRLRRQTETGGREGADGEAGTPLVIRGSEWCGADAGCWCAEGQVTDWAGDQRADEGLSLCFTSVHLSEPVELLGRPRLTLRLAADRPLALVAARLDDVFPDGVSRLVTQEVLNLTHRDGHADPQPLEPGREYDVTIELDSCACRIEADHRLRLALSPVWWPWAWPSPEPVTLHVWPQASRLELPLRPPRAADAQLAPFAAPEAPSGLGEQYLGGGDPGGRSYRRDLVTGEQVFTFRWYPGGIVRLPNGWESEDTNTVSYAITAGDPLSARAWVDCESVLDRGGQGRFHIVTRGEMTCDAGSFHLDDELEVWEGPAGDERQVFTRRWRREIPRDLV
jgi:predicted acyl esterase